jgi:hypothetical protein
VQQIIGEYQLVLLAVTAQVVAVEQQTLQLVQEMLAVMVFQVVVVVLLRHQVLKQILVATAVQD